MAGESPRKRRKINHSTVEAEDPVELLRRALHPALHPAAATERGTASQSDHAASSLRPRYSRSSNSNSSYDQPKLQTKTHYNNGERKDTGAASGSRRQSKRPEPPVFGIDAINNMNGKRYLTSKKHTAGDKSPPRPRPPRDSSSSKEGRKIQDNAGSHDDEYKDTGSVSTPRNGRMAPPVSGQDAVKNGKPHFTKKDDTARGTRGGSMSSQPSIASSRPEIPGSNEQTGSNGEIDQCIANQRRERDLLTVQSFWGDAAYERYQDASPGTAELLAYLAKEFEEKASRYYILNESLQCMENPKPAQGHIKVSREPEITCGDVRKARDRMKADSRGLKDLKSMQSPALKEDLLKKFKLRVGASGLLEPTPVQADTTQADPAESPNPPSASPKGIVQKKSAGSPLAKSSSLPAPLPKQRKESVLEKTEDSSQSHKSSKSALQRKTPSAFATTLQSLKNENFIDLTAEDPRLAISRLKAKSPPSSDPIMIDSSSSTRPSTPIATGRENGSSVSESMVKPEPTTVVIDDSTRPGTPLRKYTLKPRKKRTLSAADASSVKQTPSGVQPADAQHTDMRTHVEQQSGRHTSGDSLKQKPSGHKVLPNSKLPEGVKHANSVGNQLLSFKPPVDEQPSSSKHPPAINQSSNTQQTPLQQQSSSSAHVAATRTTSPGLFKVYSREEDCLMVYLKTVFRTSPAGLAEALPGRTPGACSTRYSTKLRHGQIPLRTAIKCLEESTEFRHHLKPAIHNKFLERLSTAPEMATSSGTTTKPRRAPSRANLAFKNHSTTEDETSDRSHSAASSRDQRERRVRKQVNYNVREYFKGTNLDQEEVLGKPALLDEPASQDIKIMPKEVRPVKTWKYRKPYLASHQRKFLRQGLDGGTWDAKKFSDWRGVSIHVGLSPKELREINNLAADFLGLGLRKLSRSNVMRYAAEADILEIAAFASQGNALPERSKESIEAALHDAQDGCIDTTQIAFNDHHPATPSLAAMTRRRELGTGRPVGVSMAMTTKVLDTIGPSMSFTGTSNDVNSVAWAPNGVQFAAGSACHVDTDSMQYNRPNNLLFGSTHKRSLQELPEHHTLRKKPASGPNSIDSMHITQDQRLFQTVASVCFSPDGRSMYSAGYDGMVRFWDVNDSGARQRLNMWRNAKIDLLTVSKEGLLATGAQKTSASAITVFDPEQSGDLERWTISSFNSRKAADCPDNKIYPSAIRFDPYDGNYLLAGFASTSREEQTRGESCLWDVLTGTQLHLFPETRNVFDVAWNPCRVNAPTFAVGCVAGTNVNRGIRSVVKMYDRRSPEKCSSTIELDCAALDMNDVMFCPFDDNYVVAGCTNGTTYVWDLRQTHKEMCLYSLVHGNPLMECADPASREWLDTGIRFCSWRNDRRRFYTGSSDGIVKSWDLYRAPEDIHVRDVVQLNSGVMCGSFSPDYSSLLLGEVNGSINVLEVGNDDRSIRDTDSFDLVSAPSDVQRPRAGSNATPDDNSGVAASKKLIETGQMVLAPMGGFPVRQALQGPRYAGPFDSAIDAEDLRDQAAVFQRNFASGDGQCNIEGCRDVKRYTEEECGDSGRWKDRIPAALTLRPKSDDTAAKKGYQLKKPVGDAAILRCQKVVDGRPCGRPIRPRLDGDDCDLSVGNHPRCELHDFACLRCGMRADLTGTFDVDGNSFFVVGCQKCGSIWSADLLGFKRRRAWQLRWDRAGEPYVEKHESIGNQYLAREFPLSKTWRTRVYGSESEDDDENGMDDHYAALCGMVEAPTAPMFPPESPPRQPSIQPPPSRGLSSSVEPSSRRASSRARREVAAESILSGKPTVAPHPFSSSFSPSGARQPDNGAQQGGAGADALVSVDSPGRRSRRYVVEDDDEDDEGFVQPAASGPRQYEQHLQRRSPIVPGQAASPSTLARGSVGTLGSDDGAGSGTGSAVQTQRHDQDRFQVPAQKQETQKRGSEVIDLEADEEGNTAAVARTAEGEDSAKRRRSSVASSQKSAASSASSNDSNKSRTPCVPM